MTTPSTTPPGWLRVEPRSTADGRTLELTVECPRDGRRHALVRCERCDAAVELVPDDTGLGGMLACAEEPRVPKTPPQRRHGAPAPDPSTVPVDDVMRDVVFVASPELPLADLALALVEHHITGAPVVDADGRLLGIASQTDLVRRWRRGEAGLGSTPPEGIVADLMTPHVIEIPPGTSVAQAAALMASEGVHRLPVVREDGVIVGLLTTLDLARWMAEATGLLAPR